MMSHVSGRRRWSVHVALRAGLVLALLQPTLGLARPATGAAGIVESLASQAMAAFKAGEFERAIELYLAAFQQDQTQAVLLFNAARVAHSGRLYERAAELYRRVIEHPDSAPAKREAAQGYLAGLDRERADAAAARARKLSEQGKHQEAAVEYRSAYRQFPERVEWLLAAARASSVSGDSLLAEKDYVEYLQRAPSSPVRGDAEAELAALRAKMRPAQASPPAIAQPAPPQRAQQPMPTVTTPLGVRAAPPPVAPLWPKVALIAGGALAVGGGALWGWTFGQERSLQAAVAPGAAPTLTHADANSQARALETRYRIGVGLAATGAVAAAVAALRLARSDSPSLAIAPIGFGFEMLAHF